MNIEIAPKSNEMTYEAAILYCQFLEHNGHRNWRMPTHAEWYTSSVITGWYLTPHSKPPAHINGMWHVTPIRDI